MSESHPPPSFPPERVIKRLRDVHAHALAALTGNAPAFADVLARLPNLALADATVLVTGETGTGKELVARAIHYLGEGAGYPFIPINCGSLPDSLFESELFGHERGAFTDARDSRHGLIAQADHGTLFLDEVECLPLRAQAALLRVLQDKSFRALGSTRERHADVRFIAATNRPLNELVAHGEFRADLYYRLCVLSIELPPLRERPEDILPLASHFLKKHAVNSQRSRFLSTRAERALLRYEWPGNVRELENAVLRGIHLARDAEIGPRDLGIPIIEEREVPLPSPVVAESGSFQDAKRRTIDAFEVEYLTRLMREHNGNVSHAARTAGKERRELGKLLKKHNLEPKRLGPRRPSLTPM